ncbi:cupin domain-containing protein [Calidithermus chliarophilus]|uniref:cupin domain-containing protein n=1 Tax=Calidithermus chliarophilus TaxID=52023 RepID=UPI0004134698|nr:cupin domain-containing protein [Calidithermus chliarophilus]
MRPSAEYWIKRLGLQPHPEGGYYTETYRAAQTLPDGRPVATEIYFLLEHDNFSALHRLNSDETWHFYTGDGLTVHLIEPGGAYRTLNLGPDPTQGQTFQGVVPAGCWFGATVDAPGGYALVGCTVAPAFDFADFELAEREALSRLYPQHRALIERLTRG